MRKTLSSFAIACISVLSQAQVVGSMGGSFAVSETGAATYTIPISVPQGINGHQPDISLTYNSQAGNGIAGMGFNISGISAISRVPCDMYHDGKANGLKYSTSDAYNIDGVRMILTDNGTNYVTYYAENAPFSTITLKNPGSTQYFVVNLQNGYTVYYGQSSASRASANNAAYIWYIDKIVDRFGNTITYSYSYESAYKTISEIKYGTTNSVKFEYESRSDGMPAIVNGYKFTINKRLKSITSTTGSTQHCKYTLTYDNNIDCFSRLSKVVCSRGNSTLPEVVFSWTGINKDIYMSSTNYTIDEPTNFTATDGNYHSLYNIRYTSADINNDGLTDIICIAQDNSSSGIKDFYRMYKAKQTGGFEQYRMTNIPGSTYSFSELYSYSISSYVIDFFGDRQPSIAIPQITKAGNAFYINFGIWDIASGILRCKSSNALMGSETPLYTFADFYNCGYDCVLYIDKTPQNGKYTCNLIGKDTGPNKFKTYASLSFTFDSAPKKLFCSDYNGDGLVDLLFFCEKGYKIYYNCGGVSVGTSPFAESSSYTSTSICDFDVVQAGDFNGDGYEDYLLHNRNSKWIYFGLSNGNGTFNKQTAIYTLDITDNSSTTKDDDKFGIQVFDANGDGRSDVVLTFSKYKSSGTFEKTNTYWLQSTGDALKLVKTSTSNRESDGLASQFITGDFNGDGYADMMNRGYDCYNSRTNNSNSTWYLYTAGQTASNSINKINKISEAKAGVYTNITYSSLCRNNIYTKGSSSSFPVADLCVPLPVVMSTTISLSNWSFYTNYSYSGLRAHLQGKGLLGFTSVTAENATTGEKTTTTINDLNTSYYEPSKVTKTTTMGGKTDITTTSLSFAQKTGKSYFVYPSSIVNTDFDGNKTTTTTSYNTIFGYLTSQTTTYDDGSYQSVSYDNKYIGGVWLPQKITTTQKHCDATSAFSSVTEYTYDSATGAVTKRTDNATTASPLYHSYTYDSYGNTLTYTVGGKGVENVKHTYTYDATHRFVTKALADFPPIHYYTYNALGWLTAETDEFGGTKLTTSYTYDDFGNATSVTYPDGTKTTITRGWNSSPTGNKRYYTTESTSNQGSVTTWYDNCDREVLIETTGDGGVKISKTTSYANNYGKLASVTNTVGSITTTEYYSYNTQGRLSATNGTTTPSVSYTYGKRSVTATDNTRGTTTTTTYDAMGNVRKVTDAVSSIDYTYASCGKPQKIVSGGATYQMVYDNAGNQTSLTDPDAGKTTYTYDALGRVATQADARGVKTTNTYGKDGKLSKCEYGSFKTEYGYNGFGNITRITASNGTSEEYTYNTYQKITSKKYKIDGNYYTFAYSYMGNRLLQTTYPTGVKETYSYNASGNVSAIALDGTTVWQLSSYNGTQRAAKLYGFADEVKKYTSAGYLTSIDHLSSKLMTGTTYTYDAKTGNLLKRSNVNTSAETFTYDKADRLTTGVTYAANGNIATKNNIGQYAYNSAKPHAVASVTNTGKLIPTDAQTVSYTTFNKVASVTQGSNSLNITYGPDHQRVKTVLKTSGSQQTRTYADNYEYRNINGTIQHLHYIYSPDGLTGVYIKPASGAGTFYVAQTDNLGNILRLYDKNGTIAYRATYDPWGLRKVTTNTINFRRGFTGHEHWDELALVDMNGRMYDPLIGRFLSPDPYVQAPTNSQNFNRYSYCLNNPLKYTDPSGELFIATAAVIGAFAYLGGVQANLFSTSNPLDFTTWNWRSASTYTGIISGAMGGADMAGYQVTFLPKIQGMITRGAFMAAGNVGINGIGNLLQKNDFFDGLAGAAICGFSYGAYTGYGLAKESGSNLWWGSKVKYGRTKWSFFNYDKPDYIISFNIEDVGSNSINNCVPTICTEVETARHGTRSYNDFVEITKYVDGLGVKTSANEYECLLNKTFDNVEKLSIKEYGNIFNPEYMRNAAQNGAIISVHFYGHVDNVRTLQVFEKAPALNKITFKQSRYNMRNVTNKIHILNIFKFF